MENKFTPGPWKLDGGNVKGDLFIWQDGEYQGGHGLARVYHDGALAHGGTVAANATLIIAAPKMLEVCQKVLGFLTYLTDSELAHGGKRECKYYLETVISEALGE